VRCGTACHVWDAEAGSLREARCEKSFLAYPRHSPGISILGAVEALLVSASEDERG
jgi:hypothetical protein